MNHNIEDSLYYHEKTKHSQASVLNSHHYLDWNNRPNPFKVYANLSSIALPSDFPKPSMNAIDAINGDIYGKEKSPGLKLHADEVIKSKHHYRPMRLTDLSSILFFTCGVTRQLKFDSGTFYMRAASATGALYPIEVYLVCNNFPDDKLDAGVYHFNPGEFSLVPIRSGDYRKILSSYAGNDVEILKSPLSLIFTSNSWRNSWKYQSRSYRHWFWDLGVIIANLLAVIKSMGLETRLKMGFVDDQVNNLLGLQTHSEASLLIASIHSSAFPNMNKSERDSDGNFSPQYKTTLEPLSHETYPLSSKQTFYPDIWKAYDASKLINNREVISWSKVQSIKTTKKNREKSNVRKLYDLRKDLFNSDSMDGNALDIGKVILKRGSSRRFSNLSISRSVFSTVLLNASYLDGKIPLDYKRDSSGLIDFYVLVNSVEGLPSGGYYLDKHAAILEFLKKKPTDNYSGHLCLDQSLFANASAVIFLMADLKMVLEILGNRGYRAAQLEAGIIAGKMYLLSYACGIGASGSTFYDNEVNTFFSHSGLRMETMIAIGIGVPAYKSKPGSILPVRLSRKQMIGNVSISNNF